MIKNFLASVLIGSSLFASDINLEISNNTLSINGNFNLPQNSCFQLRGNYTFVDYENKNNYYSGGFATTGDTPIDNYNSKVSIFIDIDHTQNNTAVPIGISVSNNNFGGYKYPLFAKAEIAYAPNILSFENASKEIKTKIEMGIEPIESGKIFIGYKTINFDENYLSIGYMGVGFSF